MDTTLAQAAGHSSPCHDLETVKLATAVELTRLGGRVDMLEANDRRINGSFVEINRQTLEALREVQTLPTEVEQRAYQVANDLRAELTLQIQNQVGTLRTEWQTSEAVRQAAHQQELTETRTARYKLYAGIVSTLVLAATAAGPNALDLIRQGAKLLFGGGP